MNCISANQIQQFQQYVLKFYKMIHNYIYIKVCNNLLIKNKRNFLIVITFAISLCYEHITFSQTLFLWSLCSNYTTYLNLIQPLIFFIHSPNLISPCFKQLGFRKSFILLHHLDFHTETQIRKFALHFNTMYVRYVNYSLQYFSLSEK